jgi:hypothetical protein
MDDGRRESALDLVVEAIHRAPGGIAEEDDTLRALEALHDLREQLDAWEPILIASARARGVSWARLAPVLGVTSRQAAERRYLRMRPSQDADLTKEQRVQAARDERAGDRAVAAWAREHAGELRQIAGQVSALQGLRGSARTRARALAGELTQDDPTSLLEPLTEMRGDLVEDHAHLAEQVDAVGRRVVALREETQRQRESPASP